MFNLWVLGYPLHINFMCRFYVRHNPFLVYLTLNLYYPYVLILQV